MTSTAARVFLNVPFDAAYKPLFDALVFAVLDCGSLPHCALEVQDSGQVRIQKIVELIGRCRYGIHDISRTEPDAKSGLPRFNMPFELGLFLGAKWFGAQSHRRKNCLILDKERYRFQQFFSDIAGQDIKAHNNHVAQIIKLVRDWLRNTTPTVEIPSGSIIASRYEQFCRDLPILCQARGYHVEELIFNDYTQLVSRWLKYYGKSQPRQ